MKFFSRIINLPTSCYSISSRQPLWFLTGPLLVIIREAVIFFRLHLVWVKIAGQVLLALAAKPVGAAVIGGAVGLFLRFQLVIMIIVIRVIASTVVGEATARLAVAAVNRTLPHIAAI